MKKDKTENAPQMKPEKTFLTSFGSFLPALAILAAGVLLTVYPSLSTTILSLGAAVVMALYGIIMIVLYFSRDVQVGILRNSLMRGFLSLGFGIFFMVRPEVLGDALGWVLGAVLLCGAAYKLQVAFDVWRMHASKWFLFVIAGVLMIIVGVVVLMNPFKVPELLMRIIGIAMIVEGVLDILAIISIHHTRKVYMREETVPYTDVVDVPDEDVTPVEDAAPVAEDAPAADTASAPAEEAAPAQTDVTDESTDD